jgi:hypothetical protein
MKKNLDLSIFGRCDAGLLLLLAGLCILPARSSGLALYNDTVNLWPDQEFPDLNNNVVRIKESFGPNAGNTSSFVGTGTIVSVVPDGNGGDYYNVLTADHVVYGADNSAVKGSYGAISIGFGSGATYSLSVPNVVNNVQVDGANNGPDLAVFSVDVTAAQLANPTANNIAAPGTGSTSLALSVPIVAPNTGNGNTIVQAGYGSQATVGFGNPAPAGTPRYLATQDFGTFNSGGNTATGTTVNSVFAGLNPRGGASANYTFNALQGTYAFTIAAGNITMGTTYILSGDSGGPTFQLNDGVYDLIGVHSSSQGFNINTANEYETQGQVWSDVQASSYLTGFIDPAILAVDVPEPSTLVLAGVGGALFLLRYGRRVARLA